MLFEIDRVSKGWNNPNPPCEEASMFYKDEFRTRWRMEIKTLEELMDFIDKYGDIVIHQEYENNMRGIEIYDGYRE